MSNKNRVIKSSPKKKPSKSNSAQPAKSNRGTLIAAAIIVVIAIVVTIVFVANNMGQGTDSTSSDNQSQNQESEETNVLTEGEAMGKHTAQIDIEGYGTITVELDGDVAPITVANFINLANDGFYDGLTFHRIMEGFMMQGGDPLGNGTGGSDNNIKGEFTSNGVENNLSHTRGAISMARSGDPDSASSQFFIVHQDSLFLDGEYACFGHVTDGMDVVDAVCTASSPTDNNGSIAPEEQPVINSIKILD